MDFKVVLSNPNNISARFNIAYKEREGVVLGYIETSENIPPTDTGINLEKDGTAGSSNIYNLRVRNETSEDIEIELVVKVGLDYNNLTIDEDKRTIGKYENILLRDYIMKLRNEDDNRDYNTSSDYGKGQMYTFNHDETEQQSGWTESELTDYRYIGDNPNNYIEFNEELWRIIGVFTIEKSDGSKEQLVKILRSESLGKLSWDANADKSYSDVWKDAEVQEMLNGAYLNSSTMTYYNYDYTTQILTTLNLNFTDTGLKDVSNQIETVKWYTAPYSLYTYVDILAEEMYTTERSNASTTRGGGPNWIGKIGLINPSDYTFTNDYNYNNSCYDKPIANADCQKKLSWLGNIPEGGSLTITALSTGRNVMYYEHAQLSSADSSRTYNVYPMLYLTLDVIVTNGDETKNSPFKIQLGSTS